MAFEKILKGKSYNLGNKTGQVAARLLNESIAKDDESISVVQMTMYDVLEVQPTENETAQAEKNGYEALPRLYLICEYNGSKGLRIKCNDEGMIEAIIAAKKPEIEVTVRASNFVPTGETRARHFFTLESWG